MPPADSRRAIQEPIALVVNDKHDIHHVRERGYVEAPVRIKSILAKMRADRDVHPARRPAYPSGALIQAVHDADFVDYLRKACAAVPEGKSVYPYVFPIRNARRPPKELSVRAGYYCIDTFTPLNPERLPGRAAGRQLHAHRGRRDSPRPAAGLRPGPAAGPPCRTPQRSAASATSTTPPSPPTISAGSAKWPSSTSTTTTATARRTSSTPATTC